MSSIETTGLVTIYNGFNKISGATQQFIRPYQLGSSEDYLSPILSIIEGSHEVAAGSAVLKLSDFLTLSVLDILA